MGVTTERSVLVSYGERPILRIDLPAPGPFSTEIVWAGFVVCGFGSRLALVDPFTAVPTYFDLDGYFGHVYPRDGCLLVASAYRLHRIEPDARLAWSSDWVAIDGVIVNEVTEDGRILGDGEWDPPGDWRPFELDLLTGRSSS